MDSHDPFHARAQIHHLSDREIGVWSTAEGAGGSATLIADLALLASYALRQLHNLGPGNATRVLSISLMMMTAHDFDPDEEGLVRGYRLVPDPARRARRVIECDVSFAGGRSQSVKYKQTHSGFGFFGSDLPTLAVNGIPLLGAYLYRRWDRDGRVGDALASVIAGCGSRCGEPGVTAWTQGADALAVATNAIRSG